MFIHIKVQYVPYTLWCTNIASVDVLFNLILIIFKSCSVRTFMNILEIVFDCAKCCDGLDIYVAIEFCCNEWIVWHHPTVVNVNTAFSCYVDGK